MVNRGIVCILTFILCTGFLPAQSETERQDLMSSAVSELFGKLGMDMACCRDKNIEAAPIFLQAGILLDENSIASYERYLQPSDKLCDAGTYSSDIVVLSLKKYLDSRADLNTASQSLSCLTEHLNTRQERESLLANLSPQFAASCPMFGSETATQLGLYNVEKADYAGAARQFQYALELNKYNLLANVKLMELLEQPNPTAASINTLSYLLIKLTVNPSDLQAAVELGQTLYRSGLYEWAADAYEYAAGLYGYLKTNTPLHDEIALGLVESCYFTISRQSQCLVVADQLRKSGHLNLAIEAVAAMAAEKLGKQQEKASILSAAAQKAEEEILAGKEDVGAMQLGWFYCFVAQNPEKALAWCNKGFTQKSDDTMSKSLMAYAFLLNQQNDMAQKYAESVIDKDPVAGIVLAELDIQSGQKDKAVETLKKSLDLYLPLPVRLKAISLLKACGSDYTNAVLADVIAENLRSKNDKKIIPSFIPLNKLISVKLIFNGAEFLYESKMEPRLVIENTGMMPLLITQDGLLTGRYCIDVNIRGGINLDIPRCIEGTFRPARAILPGESFGIQLDLDQGQLRKILFSHPQADLDLEFAVYLGPVTTNGDSIKNAIAGLTPARAAVRRKGVSLTREFLIQRLDTITKGMEGQKLRAAELFAGLYAEQLEAKTKNLTYKYNQVEDVLLADSLRKALTDVNWKVRVQIMYILARNSIPLNYNMTDSVSENLNHPSWPVRMSALWLLGCQNKSSFQPVLDWKAQYDPFWLNRNLARAMGGKEKVNSPEKEGAKPKS